jgi:hypothetical protein
MRVSTHGMGNVQIVWLNVHSALQVLIAQLVFQDILCMTQEQVHYIAYNQANNHAMRVSTHGMDHVLIVWIIVKRAPQVLIVKLVFQDISFIHHQDQGTYFAYKHQHAPQVAIHVQVLLLAHNVILDII